MSALKQRQGFLLVDILLGVAVFAIIVGSLTSGLAFSHREVIGSGDRIRAVYAAEEAIEAIRSIRDQDFALLTDGTHGIAVSGGLWTLSGTSYTTDPGYQSAITLTTLATDRMGVTVNTSWNFGINRSGSIVLYSEVNNWRKLVGPGNWTTVAVDGSYVDDGTPLFNRAVANDSYLFVTSEISDGGDGLYIFDISDSTNPTRVASSYTLSDAAHGIALNGTNLFVVTENGTEISIYDVSSPSTLSAADIVATINVADNGKAREITIDGNTLYVTSVAGGTAVSIATYDISNLASITQLDTLDEGESYYGVAVANDYAYVAAGNDTAELRIVDVTSPQFLAYPSSSGSYNLTDTADASALQAMSNYALLGRTSVAVSEEIILFDITPSPLSGNGPWYLEAGANVNDVDMDTAETYGFIASSNTGKEFSVVDIDTFAAGGSPEVSYYDTDTGDGRGVYYSWDLDRAVLLTNTAVIILKPGS